MKKEIQILVVEDDNDINQLLSNIIKKCGYLPQSAFSGTEALIYLERKEWDMILLDLMLPGITGDELIQKIRETSSVPILVISAKSEQQSKISSLRNGADDFISKPFDIEEVSARIEAHLRRVRFLNNPQRSNQLIYKDIVLDMDTKNVTVGGVEISLTVREFSILELLMTYPKKVFTKENLFETVWKEEFFGDDNTITVHLSNLRSKLAKVNSKEEYIETIWGMGYRLK